jgi:NAD(P)H dehydrogenase (quinone)
VVRERAALADVDTFALFYPLWFNAPPAMMKGYVDRVFSMGFGYGPGPNGQSSLLDGRKLISFTSSGAPETWVRDTGAFNALYTLFDQHIANMCGLQILEHVHVGGVVSGFSVEAMDDARAELRAAMARHGLCEQA